MALVSRCQRLRMDQWRDTYSPGDKGEMKASYPLYANLEKALENSLSDLPTTTVSLSAETLPDVQAGSVVLYRKFEVGEVITVRPRANAFDIDLHIKRVSQPSDQQ